MIYAVLGALLCVVCGFCLGRIFPRKTKEGLTADKTASVTRILFVWIVKACIVWTTWSYALATYATVRIGQVYTMQELSKPIVELMLALICSKVLSNIFEHNDGSIFGKSQNVPNSGTVDL